MRRPMQRKPRAAVLTEVHAAHMVYTEAGPPDALYRRRAC